MSFKNISRGGILAVVAALALAGTAGAITNGELDGDGHPHVVLVVADTGDDGGWRCSGTMLEPTVVLTAGHCVSAFPDTGEDGSPLQVTAMRIFTQSDVQAGIDDETIAYPGPGPDSIEAVSWTAHPKYEDAPFFYHDVGVVILGTPYEPGVFGQLPEEDSLDDLEQKRRRRKVGTVFTAVGYGLQQVNGAFFTGERTRMVAYPHLIQINTPGFTGDFSLLLSNNHSTGGTCFGDSGGPNFLGDSNIVAGVTSFGLNGSCGGTGGVFRMDRADVLDFVGAHLSSD